MTLTYEECLNDILMYLKRYNTACRSNQWDYWEFQACRDGISETLVYFVPSYARIRIQSEKAKLDRENFYAKRKAHWRKTLGTVRGNADEIESNALEDCEPYFKEEYDAREEYYKVNAFMEQVNSTLHSISSRLRGLKPDETI